MTPVIATVRHKLLGWFWAMYRSTIGLQPSSLPYPELYSATASELRRTLDVACCVDPVLGCAACKDSIPRAGSKRDAVLSYRVRLTTALC